MTRWSANFVHRSIETHMGGHINLNKSVKIALQAEVAHLLESHANRSVMVYT